MNLSEDQKMYGVVEEFIHKGEILQESVQNNILEMPIDLIGPLILSGKVDVVMLTLDKFSKCITFVNTKKEAEKMRDHSIKKLINKKTGELK